MTRWTVATWRRGMRAVAAQGHACVKLSMLGYAVPGWAADAAKEAQVEALVHEVRAESIIVCTSSCVHSSHTFQNSAILSAAHQVPRSRTALLTSRARAPQVIELFGPSRCMFSTNWWSCGAMANADGCAHRATVLTLIDALRACACPALPGATRSTSRWASCGGGTTRGSTAATRTTRCAGSSLAPPRRSTGSKWPVWRSGRWRGRLHRVPGAEGSASVLVLL